MKVNDILEYLNSFAPFDTCESWDNCGLLIGDKNAGVGRVLVSLDVTGEALNEAVKKEASLIIAHHPVIFGSLSRVLSDSAVYKAVSAGISVIGFHTCFDNFSEGVSFILAGLLGVVNIIHNKEHPCLVAGERQCESAAALVLGVNKALKANAAYVDSGKPIRTVAVCGGSGGDYINAALDMDADALITGECKYHEFLQAKETGLTLIAAGHYETEAVCVPVLARRVKTRFPDIEVFSYNEKSPILTLGL